MTDQPGERGTPAARRALVLLNEQADRMRAELLALRQQLTEVQRDFSESRAAQLREANQKLVLAALHADSIAETAVANLARLSQSLHHDALTGMPNRVLLLDRLDNAIVMARRHERRLAVLFVDLDHFKSINDSLGHASGDAVLKLMAQRLHSVLRESDTVSRYGGDEFLVLLPEISAAADAARVADSILAVLAAPGSVGSHPLRLSASIGISLYPEDGEDAATLIEHADVAMYRCKRGGPGRFLFYAGDGADEPVGKPAPAPSQLPPGAPAAGSGPGMQDLREANAQLVVAALAAQEAEGQAREAHRRQVKFMAMVAHELRNPLTPLRLATDLLVNRSLADEIPIHRLQAIIDGQVTHMTRLIEDLLDGSRLSTGKLRLESRDVDLTTLLEQTATACRPAMEARQQHFHVQLPPGPLAVSGDPVRLAQIFSNLLGNASKYTPAGGEITLSLAVRDRTAVVSVRDNGIGIAAEALSTIFELFVQDARALAHSDGGLGIGLTVVRDLVEAHGGSVVGHSAGLDHGSEFVVTLPLL